MELPALISWPFSESSATSRNWRARSVAGLVWKSPPDPRPTEGSIPNASDRCGGRRSPAGRRRGRTGRGGPRSPRTAGCSAARLEGVLDVDDEQRGALDGLRSLSHGIRSPGIVLRKGDLPVAAPG